MFLSKPIWEALKLALNDLLFNKIFKEPRRVDINKMIIFDCW